MSDRGPSLSALPLHCSARDATGAMAAVASSPASTPWPPMMDKWSTGALLPPSPLSPGFPPGNPNPSLAPTMAAAALPLQSPTTPAARSQADTATSSAELFSASPSTRAC